MNRLLTRSPRRRGRAGSAACPLRRGAAVAALVASEAAASVALAAAWGNPFNSFDHLVGAAEQPCRHNDDGALTMSPFVLSTMANNSLCSASGTLNFAIVSSWIGWIRCARRTAHAVRSAGPAYLPTCGFQKFHPVGFTRPGRITSRPRARYQGRSLSARGLLCSHREDRRAHGLARLQVAMRLCGVFQRVGLLDLDLDRA